MVGEEVSSLLHDKIVEELVKKLVTSYLNYFTRTIFSYTSAACNYALMKYSVRLRVELSYNRVEDGVEIYIRAYIDPETLTLLRETVEKMFKERQDLVSMRIRALKQLLAEKLISTTGGVGALLPNMYSGTSKGHDKARGDRAEVRDQEGGFSAEDLGEDTD